MLFCRLNDDGDDDDDGDDGDGDDSNIEIIGADQLGHPEWQNAFLPSPGRTTHPPAIHQPPFFASVYIFCLKLYSLYLVQKRFPISCFQTSMSTHNCIFSFCTFLSDPCAHFQLLNIAPPGGKFVFVIKYL